VFEAGAGSDRPTVTAIEDARRHRRPAVGAETAPGLKRTRQLEQHRR
jgi:hypothetical protein